MYKVYSQELYRGRLIPLADQLWYFASLEQGKTGTYQEVLSYIKKRYGQGRLAKETAPAKTTPPVSFDQRVLDLIAGLLHDTEPAMGIKPIPGDLKEGDEKE